MATYSEEGLMDEQSRKDHLLWRPDQVEMIEDDEDRDNDGREED